MSLKIKDIQNGLDQEVSGFSDKYQGVVVFCSGGPDSTALFHILYEKFKLKKNFHLVLFHINYGLREKDSEKDLQHAQLVAEQKNCEFWSYRAEKKPSELNTQQWARSIRKDFFELFAQKNYISALGHHLGDKAENCLFRLSKGSSTRLLSGLKVWHGSVWRPLLGVCKEEIYAYLRGKNLTYRQDFSNDTLMYSRNRIRNRVLKDLSQVSPKASEKIVRFADEVEQMHDFCLGQLQKEIQELKSFGKISSRTLMEKSKWQTKFILRAVFDKPGAHSDLIKDEIFEKIYNHLQNPRKWQIALQKNWVCKITKDFLYLINQQVQENKPQNLQHRKSLVENTLLGHVQKTDTLEYFDGNAKKTKKNQGNIANSKVISYKTLENSISKTKPHSL